MQHIILPQAFKNVLPTLANEFIVLLKETSVAGYIGLTDLTYAGNIVEWVNDSKVASVGGLYDAANNSKLVTIRVYISNAKVVSSGKADSSNPKTGDGIFMAVATMAASASALATGFYFNKKRAL